MTSPRPALIAIIILAGALLAGLLCSVLALISQPARQVFDDVMSVAPLVLYALAALAIGASVAFIIRLIGGAVIYVASRWHQRFVIAPDSSGAYPLIPANYQLYNPTPENVQLVGAFAAGMARHNVRPTAAATRALVTAVMQPQLPPPAWQPPAPLLATPAQAIEPDEIVLPQRVAIYNAWPPHDLSLPVGVGANGPISLPLHNLGNVLIGGLPGSGKSELMAAMIAAVALWHPGGEDVQVAVIDTKRIDFGVIPPGLPFLWRPVAVDVPTARQLIAAVLAECARRFEMLQERAARSLRQYNADPTANPLPYLVVFIDELADWTNDRGFTETALEIGRKGRAAGVSLVLATQTPRADVIDPRLRALAGAQIAFRTRSRHDSTAVLGEAGAELIPAGVPGRCLVAQGDIQPAQAYLAGIATGEFDRCLAGLPVASAYRTDTHTGAHTGIQAPNWYIPSSPSPHPTLSPSHPLPPSLPSTPDSAVSAETVRRVYAVYRGPGQRKLKTTQRLIWPDQSLGGHWWYWLDAIVRHVEGRAGRPDSPVHPTFIRTGGCDR